MLADLDITNRFTDNLPADPDTANTRRQVYKACYSWVKPLTVPKPQLVCASKEVAHLIGLSEAELQSDLFRDVFVGNKLLPNMKPYACCYGGHQFGNWAGQLGDGRAINLGEVRTAEASWALQLKGAGPTPYSRNADGLAVLRSSLREFLCSEAMYHLGIPTTRALSLILTGNSVERDMLYDGNPALEPGAVVCRVAPSFTRFGSFEIFSARGDIESLKALLDYTIRFEFPQYYPLLKADPKQAYLKWFADVCDSTINMIVHWMRVGFVHGVMNTDNLSIHGLTIDYGPYGWLDNFDPEWTPNTTDAQGKRYRYANQPGIAQWNLLQLANAIYPLIESTSELESIINGFQTSYHERYYQMMAKKLGFMDIPNDFPHVCGELSEVLHQCNVDMTLFYRQLSKLPYTACTEDNYRQQFAVVRYEDKALPEHAFQRALKWVQDYWQRRNQDSGSGEWRQQTMQQSNPKYILRNYLSQQAIEQAEQGNFVRVHELLDIMRQPYAEQTEREEFAAKRPVWAENKPGCSMLSCSS